MTAVRNHAATLLPVDSEHSAIHQALPRGFDGDLHAAGVRRIVLTASGGPYRSLDYKDLESVTVEQACAHPNWVMGRVDRSLGWVGEEALMEVRRRS
jgi:1-deoxy-D-xylulose-5-phosphate reductoisomerase